MTIANNKYKSILTTGKKLFWKYGIRRVTVEEICKDAPVSKMTFYKFFPNKMALAKHLLQEIVEKSQVRYHSTMALPVPFPEKIHRVVQQRLEETQDVSTEFIQDIYKYPETGLLAFLEEKQAEGLQEFVSDLEKARQKGWIRSDIKPGFVLYFINKINEMMVDDALIKLYDNQQDLIMELTKFFFYGIGVHHKTN